MSAVNLGFYPTLTDFDRVEALVRKSGVKWVRPMNWGGAYWERRHQSFQQFCHSNAGGSWWKEDAGGKYFAPQTVPTRRIAEFCEEAGVRGFHVLRYLSTNDTIKADVQAIEESTDQPYRIGITCEPWNTGGLYTAQHQYLIKLGKGDWRAGYISLLRKLKEAAGERASIVLNVQCMDEKLTDVKALFVLGAGDLIDEIAIAPYYAPPHRVEIPTPKSPLNQWTINQAAQELCKRCEADIRWQLGPAIERYADFANAQGKGLIAYEGGCHMLGDNPVIHEVVNTWRGHSLDALLLAVWRNRGGGDFFWYRLYGLPTKSQHFDKAIVQGEAIEQRPAFDILRK